MSMKIDYVTLCIKKEEIEGQLLNKVVHVCAWENEPNDNDIEHLVGELWESEEFGLKGDDNYEMVTLERSEDSKHIFDQLGLGEQEEDAIE